ncbi:HNH endonuclease [Mesorhizobium sp. B2-1-3]|uniref:HNH endonuclease n=1 Tax=Mesorhizobium sp. B2-1-3 TaxID=2589972 RepID=UPI0015E32D45|nr:HNH endonuclease [Mesorhizobium sp. B2-1-3]
MAKAPFLDQAMLLAMLNYDPATGIFRWKHRQEYPKRWNTRYSGKVAGFAMKTCPNVTYWSIRIFDWPFLAHRLAWLYVTGDWPATGVDHRDLDGMNNRWSNLRLASKAQNGANTRAKRNNATGYKGVSPSKNTGRFRATIQFNGEWRQIGIFDTAEAAHEAYQAEAKILHGEFARAL